MKLDENKGLILLKRGQKGLFHAVFSRFGLILVLLVVQVLILFSIFQRFEEFLPHILGGTVLFTGIMVLWLLNSQINPTAKITWLIVIMLLPVFGLLLFLYTKSDIGHRALKQRMAQIISETKGVILQDQEDMEQFSKVFFFAHILNGMRFLLLSLILTVISAALLPTVFSQSEKRIFFLCSSYR